MKIYKLLHIGEHHINHCEDYAVVESLGQNKLLCAVMDGCTMGTDSYLVSNLVGKLLRKIAIERRYLAFYQKSSPFSVETEWAAFLVKGQIASLNGNLSQQLTH